MASRKRYQKQKVTIEDENLDRFAGSSDEEDGEEMKDLGERDAENEDESVADADENSLSSGSEDSAPSVDEELYDPSAKMANMMARILGTSNRAASSSVILSKTTTPLQRMQTEEKEESRALKKKRQANRDRNLSSLHIPLSVATTNTVEDGRLSVTNELEQERFHRRVATRGVVALFNAISQHQKSTEYEENSTKRKEDSKLTKHGFLDKIKSAAATASSENANHTAERDSKSTIRDEKNVPKWDALSEDYLLGSKKNWDQESSGEESSIDEEAPTEVEHTKKKRRRDTGRK